MGNYSCRFEDLSALVLKAKKDNELKKEFDHADLVCRNTHVKVSSDAETVSSPLGTTWR